MEFANYPGKNIENVKNFNYLVKNLTQMKSLQVTRGFDCTELNTNNEFH